MVDETHLEILRQGFETWNQWRRDNPVATPDLEGAHLNGANLSGADLSEASLGGASLGGAHLLGAHLLGANLAKANLAGAHLLGANLAKANLAEANLTEADLTGANLTQGVLVFAHLSGANLSGADLSEASLGGASLIGARMTGAHLVGASLGGAYLTGASLDGASLIGASLNWTDLSGADLTSANLSRATLVGTVVERTVFSGAWVYGAAVWDLKGLPKDQCDLVITPDGEPTVTVDDLKVAQFVYLLLSNPNIRDVIDTIGEKGVLILGRFGDRKYVLDKLRNRLRELGFAPMVFDFERPTSKDFTETVKTLAGMSAFIVADITKPKSVPQEAQAIIPDYMVPFVPLIEGGEEPWAMFQDLWIKHRDWVFEPLVYSSVDALIPRLGNSVVKPALEMRKVLLARRAEEMGARSLDDFELDSE